MASRRPSQNTNSDDDGEHGDSGIDENTTDEPEPSSTNPQAQAQSTSKKSAKERFQEKSSDYQKLIEQSSRYRRKGSTPRAQADQGSIRVDAGGLRPSPRVPVRPLNRDRAGEGKGRRDSTDDVTSPRMTVMIKEHGKGKGRTRTVLPPVGANDPTNELPSYTKNDLPAQSKDGPSYSKKGSASRHRTPRGLESKSLPNTPRDPPREPLSARGTNINKISMDDATKSLLSPRKPRPAKLSPLRN